MRRPAALALVLAVAAPALLAASCQAPAPPPVEIRRDYTPPGDAPCGPFCQGGCYREDRPEAGPCTCGCQAAKPKPPVSPKPQAPRQVVRVGAPPTVVSRPSPSAAISTPPSGCTR